MDVKDLFINILTKKFSYPVRLQGSLSDTETYPDSFFTFWNNDVSSDSHYDNKQNKYIWDFDLNFYSNDPSLTNSVLMDAIKEIKTHGFIVSGKGYDVISDEPTHTGRGINLLYEEMEREG